VVNAKAERKDAPGLATEHIAPMATPNRWRGRELLALVAILLVASGTRFYEIGRASLWFDEVITMRVARAGSPGAVLEQLRSLDGTRAPLHPLLLAGWMNLFGTSEAGGRSLSAVLGVITVFVIYGLGRAAFDSRTGLWSAWLAALCPPLIYYSREVRMYSWLVLLTCVSWLLFLSFRRSTGRSRCALYALLLASLAYSHPVGLFMIVAHGVAYLFVRKRLELDLRSWVVIQALVLLATLPWLGQYLQRGTDYPLPRYGLTFLLAVPIEYIGGNKWVLLACLGVIGHGLLRSGTAKHRSISVADPLENVVLVTWAVIPPLLMYGYSYMSKPIFGPPRYHLFIAPAYLILLGHGLERLPLLLRGAAVLGALYCSLHLLWSGVYPQPLKADWKAVAVWLDGQVGSRRATVDVKQTTVIVHPSDPRFPREELEAARYYLGDRFRVEADRNPIAITDETVVYDALCHSRAEVELTPVENGRTFFGLSVVQRVSKRP
jgi:4-amino-4-deoxy-L-arabinose transferase-like glycosyltransferase